MKNFLVSAAMIILVFSLEGCSGTMMFRSPGKSGSAPGQIKKSTGSQSAKPYAPGQQK